MTNDDLHRLGYYTFPKVLLDGRFKELTSDSKIVFMIMLDLERLSAKNLDKFSDENGIYIVMTLKTIQSILNCSEPKAIKILKELENFKMITKKVQGKNKPTKIFLVHDLKNIEVTTLNNFSSRPKENLVHDLKNIKSNNNYINNNDFNNNNMSKSKGAKPPKDARTPFSVLNAIDETDFPDRLKAKLREYVNYKKQQHNQGYEEMGFKKFLTQVKKTRLTLADDEIIDSIDKTIMNGWKGIGHIHWTPKEQGGESFGRNDTGSTQARSKSIFKPYIPGDGEESKITRL